MIKLVGLLVLAWLVFKLFSKVSQTKTANTNQQNKPMTNDGTMVACQKCGLHILQTKAVIKNEKNYCCIEHLP